ncbi:MAG TPA: DUF2793 domain-containing protein [Sphingomicrobium sp.]|nr:DUF2793 domain-containing protein [Sphingomicrobium sp.]
MAGTTRLDLALLSVGQAQKEFTHNESLQTLDILVAGAIEELPRATPPASPSVGACYIVGPAAVDAWVGMSGSIAAWTSGGWQFVPPMEGMTLYERTSSIYAVYRNGAWELGMVRGSALVIGGEQVVGQRSAAIASPAGGSVIDVEGRVATAAILDALRAHGLIEA